MENQKQKKISLTALILMTFTTIYGFANTTVAYEQMGYASIFWYILAALLFFLPSALMFAEYGSAFKEAKGGIYSWLAGSIGEKWAFIGTFIWLSSWIIWMVSTASKVWIPFSTVIFGSDQTQTWHFLSLTSTETVALLGIAWIILVTFLASHGMSSIAKISSVGGVFVMLLTVIFALTSIVILFANHGQLAQPITGVESFIKSPNPDFTSPVALISFVVYAVFAYAGSETMGGITDSLHKPEKTFPKGLIISTVVIGICYSLSIFLWGISTNWHQVLGNQSVNLGNITYVLMDNLGLVLGNSLGLTAATAATIGHLFARFSGLSMFMAYMGSFFILIYSPLKSFVLGSSADLWPARMTKRNKHGMPAFSMWIQAVVVGFIIFIVAFGGSGAQKFYLILTDMGNISTTFPYLFLVAAFPFFKKRTDLERPFEIFTNKKLTMTITVLVMIVLVGGIGFTGIQPIMDHDYQTALYTILGPFIFGGIAWWFYASAMRRRTK